MLLLLISMEISFWPRVAMAASTGNENKDILICLHCGLQIMIPELLLNSLARSGLVKAAQNATEPHLPCWAARFPVLSVPIHAWGGGDVFGGKLILVSWDEEQIDKEWCREEETAWGRAS